MFPGVGSRSRRIFGGADYGDYITQVRLYVGVGSAYWAIKILNGGASGSIKIGCGTNVSVCESDFAGRSAADMGVSYDGQHGHRHCAGNFSKFGHAFTTGDEIGLLANMEHRTITFFKNGTLVGTAMGSDRMDPKATYFPIVSLSELGAQVVCCKINCSTVTTSVPVFMR